MCRYHYHNCANSSILSRIIFQSIYGVRTQITTILNLLTQQVNRLSAYLYYVTDNQTFRDAAHTSRTFIDAHLHNKTGGYVSDGFGIQPCNTADSLVMTYNTGLYLEGLSVFANKTGDSDLMKTWVPTMASEFRELDLEFSVSLRF